MPTSTTGGQIKRITGTAAAATGTGVNVVLAPCHRWCEDIQALVIGLLFTALDGVMFGCVF